MNNSRQSLEFFQEDGHHGSDAGDTVKTCQLIDSCSHLSTMHVKLGWRCSFCMALGKHMPA